MTTYVTTYIMVLKVVILILR